MFWRPSDMVVQRLPSPVQLNEERARALLTTAVHDYASLPHQSRQLVTHLQSCSSKDSAPLVVYVSKVDSDIVINRKYVKLTFYNSKEVHIRRFDQFRPKLSKR